MIKLDNQVSLITGAARGLGLEYAKLLSQRGAHVIMQDTGVDKDGKNANPDIVNKVAATLSEKSVGQIVAVSMDLADKNNCMQLSERIIRQFGRIDIVIHNAGWVAYEEIGDLSTDFLQRAIDVNILIPTWLMHFIFPIMQKQNYGRVVLTSSDRAIYQEYALPGLAPYAMGKMAQIGLMNVLAVEGHTYNICVNTISPVSKTRMWDVTTEPEDLKPSQIADGVLFLASAMCNDSGYILRASNGQFTAAKWIEREGVDYPYNLNAFESSSAEDIAQNWEKIKQDIAF